MSDLEAFKVYYSYRVSQKQATIGMLNSGKIVNYEVRRLKIINDNVFCILKLFCLSLRKLSAFWRNPHPHTAVAGNRRQIMINVYKQENV